MNRTLAAILSFGAALGLVSGTSPAPDTAPLGAVTPAPAAAADWTEPVNISPNLINLNADARVVTSASGLKAYAIWEESHGGPKKIHFTTNESGSWAEPVNIMANDDGEYPTPEIALDNDGNPLAVFQAKINGNYELLFRQRKNGAWLAPENFTNTPQGGSQSPSILVDRDTNDFYVLWQDDYQRPTDEAVYWKIYLSYKVKGEGPWVSGGLIREGTARCYFPVADIDAKGKIYVTFDNRAPGNALIQFAQNPTPKVFTAWSSPVNVSAVTGLSFSYSKIACDDAGNVYVVWTQKEGAGDNVEVYFRKRINGVWRAEENISKTPGVSSRPTVAVNRDSGKVYIAWTEQVGTTAESTEIYYKESEGAGWSAVRNMTRTDAYSDYPTLFTDRVGGVHLVYTDLKNGYYHIYYRMRRGEGLCFPPTEFSVESRAAGDPRKKTNTLTWKKNPENEGVVLTNYKIYRKAKDADESAYKLLATPGPKVFEYKDANLAGVDLYTYKATAVAKGGHESADAVTADDQFITPPLFPPVDLAVASAKGATIYRKDNTLTWRKNAKNKDSEVTHYRLYRKEAGADDATYVKAGEVVSSILSFKDVGLAYDKRYTYVAAAYSVYGAESASSAPVTDVPVFTIAYPPLSPDLTTRLDAMTGTKTNVLTWKIDARNRALPIISTRVYRRAEGETAFILAGAADADANRFSDFGLSTGIKYVYRLVAVPAWKVESAPSVIISEARIFPPFDLLFEKTVNTTLFYRETINRLTWKRSALNDPVTVAGYKIFRKKASEKLSAFTLIATADGAALEYLDRSPAAGELLVYRLRAVDAEGRQSDYSAIVGED